MQSDQFWPLAEFSNLYGSPSVNARHLIARESFMHHLKQHPDVLRMFSNWRSESRGMVDKWSPDLKRLNRISDMNSPVDRHPAEYDFPEGLLSEEKAWYERSRNSLVEFVNDQLQLGWAWIVCDLLDEFQVCFSGWRGSSYSIRAVQLSPAVTFEFRTFENESCESALRRFNNEAKVFRQNFRRGQGPPRRGAVLRNGGSALRKYAFWFFLNHVENKSVREIARTNHKESQHPREFAACECSKTVRDGIKEARRLLRLPTLWHWDPTSRETNLPNARVQIDPSDEPTPGEFVH